MESYYCTNDLEMELDADKHLGQVHFDEIDHNWRKARRQENRQRRQDEFDIVLTNNEAVGLVVPSPTVI